MSYSFTKPEKSVYDAESRDEWSDYSETESKKFFIYGAMIIVIFIIVFALMAFAAKKDPEVSSDPVTWIKAFALLAVGVGIGGYLIYYSRGGKERGYSQFDRAQKEIQSEMGEQGDLSRSAAVSALKTRAEMRKTREATRSSRSSRSYRSNYGYNHNRGIGLTLNL